MQRDLVSVALLGAAASIGLAWQPVLAAVVSPGQYSIGGIQQICIEKNRDGEWYGTTYNFFGASLKRPRFHDNLALYGNYALQGQYLGYGNVAITFQTFNGALVAGVVRLDG